MKRILLFFSLLFLPWKMIEAATITSVVCGDWTNTNTWDLNRLPVATDTIVVNTFVSFDADFESLSPGMLNVTICGTLCGEHIYTGHFLFDGIIYVGRLILSYGQSISNTDLHVLQSILIAGGSFIVHGQTCVGCTSLCQNCSTRESSDICTTGISAVAESEMLYCYPNPAANALRVKGITRKTTLLLFDLFGKLVIEKETSNNITLDTSRLPAGIYNLVAEDNTNRIFCKVVIAEH